jgi:ribosomal protein S18 acetylase RimI-like enzyme
MAGSRVGPVVFRPARKDDARTIASLYRIASEGVSDYVWSLIMEPGEGLLDVGERRYARDEGAFSYRSCTVAEVDAAVAGMLMAFPMHVEPEHVVETDPVLRPYASLEEDASLYVAGLALFEAYRSMGIGSQLMALAEQHARGLGLAKTSLIVFENNAGALDLYRRLGYREVMREAIVPHPLIHHQGDALLLVKALAA